MGQPDAPLLVGRQLSGKAGTAAPFHFFGKLPHGLLIDHPAFAASEGRSRIIQRSQELRTLAFTLLPQCKSFLHRIFFIVKSTALNGLANEGFLIGSESDFHCLPDYRNALLSTTSVFSASSVVNPPLHRLENTNWFPSGSLKIPIVPHDSFLGSADNSTPFDCITFAVAKTSSHQNVTG